MQYYGLFMDTLFVGLNNYVTMYDFIQKHGEMARYDIPHVPWAVGNRGLEAMWMQVLSVWPPNSLHLGRPGPASMCNRPYTLSYIILAGGFESHFGMTLRILTKAPKNCPLKE
jgi:hypothetical protein